MSGAVGAGRLVWVRQGFERVSEKAPGGRDNTIVSDIKLGCSRDVIGMLNTLY